MRKIISLLLVLVTTTIAAQNNDYLVSMDGIGPIKLGMTQAELETLLNKKIALTNPSDTISGSWQDSAKIKYKNIDLQLDFQRNYFAENTFNMIIISIRTSNPLCKTRPGIGIGADKLKIITAYEGFPISMGPEYEEDGERSKTKYQVTVNNDTGERRRILFYLTNKKVVAIKVEIAFSDSE
jgi:hypothetical protein